MVINRFDPVRSETSDPNDCLPNTLFDPDEIDDWDYEDFKSRTYKLKVKQPR